MIAQEMAINYPEKVKGLALLYTGPGGSTFDYPGQRKAIEKMSWFSNPPPGMRPEVVMEEILRLVYYREWLEANRDRIIASTTKYPTPTITYARQYEALVTFDTTGRLNKIKSSTLVVHGEDDEAIFPEAAMFMAKHIPGA